MVCWLIQSRPFRDNFTENDWLTFVHWPSASVLWERIFQKHLGAAPLSGTHGHWWDWLGLLPCRQKSWASGWGARMNLIREGGKPNAAGGTAGPSKSGTMHARLSGWCSIAICLKEKRAMSLHQGLHPKSTEVREGLLEIVRHFGSTRSVENSHLLPWWLEKVNSFQHCCNFSYQRGLPHKGGCVTTYMSLVIPFIGSLYFKKMISSLSLYSKLKIFGIRTALRIRLNF